MAATPDDTEHEAAPAAVAATAGAGSSKYDFVKVRVSLSPRHAYVLSRFLVSRVLTAARVRGTDAVRIALDLKKAIVDAGARDTISQQAMEDILFTIAKRYGYGHDTLVLYQRVSRYGRRRRAGTGRRPWPGRRRGSCRLS